MFSKNNITIEYIDMASLLDQAKKEGYKQLDGTSDVADGVEFPVSVMAKISGSTVEITKVAPPGSAAVPGQGSSSSTPTGPASTASSATAAGTPLRNAAVTAIDEAITEVDRAVTAADDAASKTAIGEVDTKVTAATTAATAANDTNTDASQKTSIEAAIKNILDPILKELIAKTTKSDIDAELNKLKPELEALKTLFNGSTTIIGGKKSSKTQRRRMRKYRGSAKRRNRSGKRV